MRAHALLSILATAILLYLGFDAIASGQADAIISSYGYLSGRSALFMGVSYILGAVYFFLAWLAPNLKLFSTLVNKMAIGSFLLAAIFFLYAVSLQIYNMLPH
jgi:hypothetical protein